MNYVSKIINFPNIHTHHNLLEVVHSKIQEQDELSELYWVVRILEWVVSWTALWWDRLHLWWVGHLLYLDHAQDLYVTRVVMMGLDTWVLSRRMIE